MKRELKKLTLSRETLRLLTDRQIAAAAGGQLFTYTCLTRCNSNAGVCCT